VAQAADRKEFCHSLEYGQKNNLPDI